MLILYAPLLSLSPEVFLSHSVPIQGSYKLLVCGSSDADYLPLLSRKMDWTTEQSVLGRIETESPLAWPVTFRFAMQFFFGGGMKSFEE